MYTALRSTWALFLGIGLIMLGNGLQGSLLSLRAALEGFPTATTGAIMTGYYLGFLAGSTLTPRILRNVGHVRVFAALASLASSSVLLHAVFIDATTWFAMRLVTGFSYAGLYIVAESWLNDRATNETRGQLLSLYMVIMLGGLAAGQLLLNAASPQSFELFVLISVLVSLALVPISLTATQAPPFAAPATLSLRRLYAISPLGLVGVFGTGLAHGALLAMGAVYGQQRGLSVAQISVFMSLLVFGGMCLQWPIGWLSDRFDRRRVLTGVTLAAAGAALAAVYAADLSQAALLVLAALIGGLSLPMYSLCLAHTNDHLEPEQMVSASSSLVLVGGIGACLGPFSAAAAMSLAGAHGFFWTLAAAHGAIGAFALYRMTRREAVPLEAQRHYVAVPSRATFVATSMSPQELGAGDRAPSSVRDQRDRDLARMSRSRR